MEQLRIFLNALSVSEQESFAKRCGTTIGYLRKAISKGTKLGTELCVLIEKNSNSVVKRQHLYPEDWEKNWPELAA
ncbi:Cro/Cl family transcriptional regulator [Morganella morganii]|uniref:Cro/Cl family transcriptional regulator n=1 Tax=Morganella morganii TaxID=582 RepID=UPI001BD9B481|nr:Cro/Cl family transcriptional regulator [Morganella morganii]MBT0337427.1 Cro/Cl family transcriptional regulator [Morganella morganii subsp. morganii]HDU8612187.1 Cro/Cl family transcriptional regulator [Morganella morganii]